MLCHQCGNEMPLGQRVCATCGATDDLTPPGGGPAVFTIVEQTEAAVPQRSAWATPDDAAAWYPPTPSGSTSTIDSTIAMAQLTGEPPPGTALVAALACLAGIATIAGAFMLILHIDSDAAIPQYLGDYGIGDLDGVGTNFQVAFILAGALMLLGGLLLVQGGAQGFGAGLVAGASLAVVPFVVFMATGSDMLADRALFQAQAVATAGGGGTEFSVTFAAGFFVLIGAAVVGVAACLAALRYGRDDGREPLNTWLCVGAAIACLVAGAGQLIPENGRRFADNYSNPFNEALFVYSRLGIIVVMAVVGILGFLLASRFGLGLAVGAVSLYVWQWASSQFEVGNLPLPPAFFNPGGLTGKPHPVTTIGVSAMLALLAALAITARRHDRSAVTH